MKEIEVKAKLKDKDSVIKQLELLGCIFEAPVTQEDTVYAERVDSLKSFRSCEIFLRLRVKNGKHPLFTLKKKMSNDLDAIEHEVEVGSKEEMERAILLMGYKEAIRVNKTRMITRYNDCEICIDEVEGLGTFIEMEKLTKDGDSEKIQEEMFNFFESLGISRADRATSGYDILLWVKRD